MLLFWKIKKSLAKLKCMPKDKRWFYTFQILKRTIKNKHLQIIVFFNFVFDGHSKIHFAIFIEITHYIIWVIIRNSVILVAPITISKQTNISITSTVAIKRQMIFGIFF